MLKIVADTLSRRLACKSIYLFTGPVRRYVAPILIKIRDARSNLMVGIDPAGGAWNETCKPIKRGYLFKRMMNYITEILETITK